MVLTKMFVSKMDINYLEHQYSPSKWVVRSIENGQDVINNFFEIGLKARQKAVADCLCDLDIEYTNGKNTKLDIYYPGDLKSAKRDVLIFIHGGYWQAGSKENHAFLATQVKALDCVLVLPGYDLAPHGSMDGMVAQIKNSVEFVAKKFPHSRIFLGGHSAGAHLCAMMLSTEWNNCDILTRNRLNGVCLVSGIYDLVPLLSTSVNEPLKMNREIAQRNSPMAVTTSERLRQHCNCKGLVVVGEHDSPEFQRQSKEYYELLKKTLTSVSYLEIPGVDHFDIFEKCLQTDFCLVKEIHKFLKK